jgi:TRAP-type C4-dicarboxylate transport system substrate-binding protein
MLEPLLMSKQIFDALPKDQQTAITEVGIEMEPFALKAAKDDDEAIAAIYKKANIPVADMDAATVEKWRKIAEDTAWKDFAARNADCDKLLKLAAAVA